MVLTNLIQIHYCLVGAVFLLGFFCVFCGRTLTFSEVICYFLLVFLLLLTLSNCYHAFEILHQCQLGLIKKVELVLQLQEQITVADSNKEKLVNIPESTTASKKPHSTKLLVVLCVGTAVVGVILFGLISLGGEG